MKKQEERTAHALSLHLYSILSNRAADGSTAEQTILELQQFLVQQHLQHHLIVAYSPERPHIRMKPTSEFADTIMLELFARCEFFPCPTSQCQYAPECQWCRWLKE